MNAKGKVVVVIPLVEVIWGDTRIRMSWLAS